MAQHTLIFLAVALLPAVVLAAAPAPDPLAGLLATSLAPGIRALDSNPPLAKAFLSTPFFAELARNAKATADTPDANFLMRDPQVAETEESIPKDLDPTATNEVFLKALPPLLSNIFKETAVAPVTGDADADMNHINHIVEAVPGTLEAVRAGYNSAGPAVAEEGTALYEATKAAFEATSAGGRKMLRA